jgi:hypothetical protein
LAANQTLEREGIVSVTIVFGIILHIGIILQNNPECKQTMVGACEEMRKILATAEVARAL